MHYEMVSSPVYLAHRAEVTDPTSKYRSECTSSWTRALSYGTNDSRKKVA